MGLVKNFGTIKANKLIVKEDTTGLLFLSEDELTILYKCGVCKKYPCECEIKE